MKQSYATQENLSTSQISQQQKSIFISKPVFSQTSAHISQNFDPKDYVRPGLTEREITMYKQIFDYFDADNVGTLTPKDIRCAIQQYSKYNIDKQYSFKLFAYYDEDGSGEIDFEEFLNIMNSKPYQSDQEEDIKKVFDQIDYEGKGYITLENLEELRDQNEEHVSNQQLQEIIKNFDPENSGKISWAAFLQFNKSGNFF